MSLSLAESSGVQEGPPLRVVTLDNGRGLRARVMNYGATLLGLEVPDRLGRVADVTLGFDEPRGYFGVHPYFGAVIGRYANRIAGARFGIGERQYVLRANEGRNQLHGGPRGFDKAWWTEAGQRGGEMPEVSWHCTSPDGDEGYPGQLEVQVTYRLTDDSLQVEWVASTDAPTVINLTHHAYWNLAGRGDVLGHQLQLFGSRFLPVNGELLPTGELRSVTGTPMDFLTPAAIGARLDAGDPQLREAKNGYDHCWVLEGHQLAARLVDPVSGRVMELSTTQPALQFYSGNQLDGSLTGKGGRAYPKYAGLCLEPQHFPDSPHHSHFPSTLLRPGVTYRHSAAWRFFTD